MQNKLLFSKDEFYDKKETKTTPGQYNPSPVSQRRKRRKSNENFRLSFGSEQVTQVGGYPMLEKEYSSFDLRRKLSRGLRKKRGANGFTSTEISQWIIDQKMLGIRRFHHADTFRFDPVLEEIYGIRGLPSDTTVGNYLRSFTPYDNEKLTRVVDRITKEGLSRVKPFSKDLPVNKMKKPKREIVLDIDGTELTVYGKQEKAKRGHSKRKKDSPQYRMLSSFITGLEWWLDYQLLPGNMSLRGHGDEMIKRAGVRLPDGWAIGGVRGDTALYNGEDIKRWNQREWTLGISAQKTQDLKRKIGAIPEKEWKRYEDEQVELIGELAEIKYKPKSWDHGPYRYIVSRRKRKLKRSGKQRALFSMDPWYDYFAYITNHKGDLLSAYQFVVGRCNVENCIKESKIGFDGKEVPHKEYEANRAYLGHAS